MRIYTDASTKNNLSGIGFIVTNEENQVIHKGSVGIDITDNNTAELAAILFALEKTKRLTSKTITILTDSSYAIRVIRNRTYRANEVNLVNRIREELKLRKCNLFWIKGHNKDNTYLAYFNHQVDHLAKEARKRYENKILFQEILKNKLQSKYIHD